MILFSSLVFLPRVQAASLSLDHLLVNMVKLHPVVQIKGLEQKSAEFEIGKAESKLGWYLKGNGGRSHDLSFLGTPTDISSAGLGLEKTFGFGGRVNIDGTYEYEDAEVTISPLIPNPSASTNFDLKYLHPLGRGSGNPEYKTGIVNAEAANIIAQANWQENRDTLTKQVIDLYYSLAKTNAQIRNTELAINRAKRLQEYTVRNISLGVSEKKDLLQTEARLQASIADKASLQINRERQYVALNRLAALPWETRFELLVSYPANPVSSIDFEKSYKSAKKYSWGLKKNKAQIDIALATIEKSRDLNRDDLNLVFSAGSRNRNGEVSGENFNETDYAAGVRLEYRRALDRQGLEAELTQAQIRKSIGFQEKNAIELDLGYQLSSLLSEMKEMEESLVRSKKSLQVEKLKNNEALSRYKNGRADTSELINFENDLRFAEFTVTNKELELARMVAQFELLSGDMWDRINRTLGFTMEQKQ